MHLLLPVVLSILATTSLPLLAAADAQAYAIPSSKDPKGTRFNREPIPWETCTPFKQIWSKYAIRIDSLQISTATSNDPIHPTGTDGTKFTISYYVDDECKIPYGDLPAGIVATVALTKEGKNIPDRLSGTPGHPGKYPKGKNVFNDMKAFMMHKV